jgi:nucleoside 2-deoxyribosyltransferase
VAVKAYIVGSLRNPRIIEVTNALTEAGFDVFSDWFAAGERADDTWMAYEKARGRTYREALASPAAQNVFAFDQRHIEDADVVVLVAPAGRSGHIELGYAIGRGKPGFILMDEPGPDDRWDVMLLFATGIAHTVEELVGMMRSETTHDVVYRRMAYCPSDRCNCVRCVSQRFIGLE